MQSLTQDLHVHTELSKCGESQKRYRNFFTDVLWRRLILGLEAEIVDKHF